MCIRDSLDTTLQLTQVERGYVFLRNEAGEMQLALGREDVYKRQPREAQTP